METSVEPRERGKSPNGPLLEVKDLQTYFFMSRGEIVKAVDGVSFRLDSGKTLGIVGESGSGKSVTARSILGIVDFPGRTVGGEVWFRGQNLLALSESQMISIRGKRISMIFQDPGTSLNPVFRVGTQIVDTIRAHQNLSPSKATERAIDVLKTVGIANPEEVMPGYPMDFSAGMVQRIMIAVAISCDPDVILADEPTTTLGITVQAQILSSLADAQRKLGTAIVMITHDFGVVSQVSDEILVMYAGVCVERGTKRQLLSQPLHPYTLGLIRSVPELDEERQERLSAIPGFPPDMSHLPPGCAFAPRCSRVVTECKVKRPVLQEVERDHLVACYSPIPY